MLLVITYLHSEGFGIAAIHVRFRWSGPVGTRRTTKSTDLLSHKFAHKLAIKCWLVNASRYSSPAIRRLRKSSSI
ncbi:hypothetical protein Y032_0141g2251 [Ancylostoma ceylanicum]|uniref:Uncharacterized protein n=1 Tax=Ancylostoma ceylanicum TaxID=53326 RepID=A0A016T3U8_9BILA|nr:hypothetical protein Y032_0141g2251 [Ancylostoma ceylanicum]